MKFDETYLTLSKSRIVEHDRNRKQISIREGRDLPSIESLRLGDASRMFVTALFFDLVRFSQLSEGIPLGSTLRLMDLLLVELTRVIKDGDGVLDKYTGDGFLALFSGPSEEAAVSRGIEAAMTISCVVKRVLSPYLGQIGLPQVEYKMGMDAGTVLIARLGIRGTNELTVMGPTVNIASKITDAASAGEIRVGADIHQRLGDRRRGFCERLGKVPGFTYEYFRYKGRWSICL